MIGCAAYYNTGQPRRKWADFHLECPLSEFIFKVPPPETVAPDRKNAPLGTRLFHYLSIWKKLTFTKPWAGAIIKGI